MERRIYLSIFTISTISVALTSFLIAFFKGENGFLKELLYILPVSVSIIVLMFIVLNRVAYYLTQKIMEPIDSLAREIENIKDIDNMKDIYIYDELKPIVKTVQHQKYEVEKSIGKLEESNQYRRDLTANITHELKTPLTSINGFAEMLASGMVSPEDTIKFGSIIHKEGIRLLDLIDSILNLSSIEKDFPEFELLNIKEIFSEIYHPLKVIGDSQGVELLFEVENISLLGNKRMLKDLLYNLIHNSIKYNKDQGLVYVYIYRENKSCIINIRDTGIGIGRDDKDKIFNRFYTVEKSRNKKNSGTGIGLSIVKHIVMVHNGSIKIQSELDQGTDIKIELPM